MNSTEADDHEVAERRESFTFPTMTTRTQSASAPARVIPSKECDGNGNPLLKGAMVVDLSSQTNKGDGRKVQGGTVPTSGRNTVAGRNTFEKGFSQLAWVRKTQDDSIDLSGLHGRKPRNDITLEEVAKHNSCADGWTILRGRVYNLSPYMKYHPGGEMILKPVLGKDCTKLFNEYHAWVNAEFLLKKCFIGVLDTKDSNKDTERECSAI